MTPYYEQDGIVIYHGDCQEILPALTGVDVLVTDPPYGIAYFSARKRRDNYARGILGDMDAVLRDWLVGEWDGLPALLFGSWRISRPAGTRAVLIWDKGGALGMGDLSLPWKLDHEEIYVIGHGWRGSRDTGSVLRVPPEQSLGRDHPHQKPLRLMKMLLEKCLPSWVVLDPFMGSGSTLVAAKQLGRRAIGIEIEERYCEIAAKRLAQGVLSLEAV